MKKFFDWVNEILLWVIYIVFGLVGYFFPLKSLQPNKGGGKTLVVVHAWQTTSLPYLGMKRFFQKRDCAVYFPDFGFHMGDIEKDASKLNAYMEKFSLNDVILVGVSVGALISLKYLQKYGHKRVAKLISVGGPMRGTRVACLAFYSKAARQMLPKSEFIKSLRNEGLNMPKRIFCIYAKEDEFVSKESSCLSGATAIEVDVVGHVRLQFSVHTFMAIEKLMNG